MTVSPTSAAKPKAAVSDAVPIASPAKPAPAAKVNSPAPSAAPANATAARADLQRFNQSFDSDFAAAWKSRSPADRRTLLTNTLGYLGKMRTLGTGGGIGIELAAAYRRIARFQEQLPAGSQLGSDWTMGPVYGYQASALILTQLANDNPNDPSVRGLLVQDVGRVEALGGKMPVMAAVPVGGAPPQEERGIPASAMAPAPAQSRAALLALPGPPSLNLAAVPASEKEAATNALDRYTGVMAAAKRVQEGIRPLQESVAASGQSLHPDTVKSLTRMRANLEAAKAEIESRQFAKSLESLTAAEAEARKILKMLGR